jgi:acyl-CoA hydrolase
MPTGSIDELGDELCDGETSGALKGDVSDADTDGGASDSPVHAVAMTTSAVTQIARRITAAYRRRRRMPAMTRSDLVPKRAAASHVTLTQMMEVTDANVAGNVHGGAIMRLVDTAAALAAIRHAGGLAVTVSLDEMSFLEPVHIGDVLTLHAAVNDVGTTSMECGVRVEAENPITGTRVHAASAHLVFVAIDEAGHPRPVPPLIAESDDELRRQREAKLRRQTRMAHKEALKAARKAESSAGR